MKKIRVLVLTDRFPPHDRGGAERIAYYHAHALKEEGFRVAVFTSQEEGVPPAHEPVEEEGIQVFRSFSLSSLTNSKLRLGIDKALVFPSMIWNPWMKKKLHAAAGSFSPDLIHAHQIHRISYGAFIKTAPGIPHFLTFHGYQFECPKGGLYRKQAKRMCEIKPICCAVFSRLMRLNLKHVDRIIAISHFIQHRLIDCGYDPSKIVYIPNGVPGLKVRELTPPEGTKQILYVGRVAENKGVQELITAFQKVQDPEARLVIVGDGPYMPSVRSLAGDNRRIVFMGWQKPESVSSLYQSSRMVVVPSLWHEVMNTVICEAQSWARPVIATRVGGNADLIEDGVSGMFYAPGDVDALSSAISRLLEDDVLVQRMGEDGFQRVGRYTIQRHIKSIKELYSHLGIG